MGKVRGVLTAPSEMEAHARFRALAQEDASLARYLLPRDPVRKPSVDGQGEGAEGWPGLALGGYELRRGQG